MDPTTTEPRPPIPELQPTTGVANGAAHTEWNLDEIPWPNIEDIEIEDGKPVESMFIQTQMRLLTEPLYASWAGPGEGRPYVAMANVGLFYRINHPPLVPDVMLAVDIVRGNLALKQNRTYFVWERGKPPDVAIEIVSDRRGDEDSYKLREYAEIGIPYYAIFDPDEHLKAGVLRIFERRGKAYELIAPGWFSGVGLGLQLWPGVYEGEESNWLRWCSRDGQVIPTGAERAEAEHQRAERLLAQLREHGIEPPE